VTDITGFGLLGHGMEMARRRQQIVLELNQIPLLTGAANYAAQFIFPGGASNNKMFFEKDVTFAPIIPTTTSGCCGTRRHPGAYFWRSRRAIGRFQSICAERNQPAWVVGQVIAGSGIEVVP